MYIIEYYNEGGTVLRERVEQLPNRLERMGIARKYDVDYYDRFKIFTGHYEMLMDSDYNPDIIVIGGYEFLTGDNAEKIKPPPEYVVIEEVDLLDAFTNKTYTPKTIVARLPKGMEVQLMDCDPGVVSHELVGVRTEDGKFSGYVGKTKIKKRS